LWLDKLFAALPSVFPKAAAVRPTKLPVETPKIYVRTCSAAAEASSTATSASSARSSAGTADHQHEHFRAACRASAAFSALAGIAAGSRPWNSSLLLNGVPGGEQLGKESSNDAQAQPESFNSASRSIESPLWSEVVRTERLTAADHWQVQLVSNLDHDNTLPGMKRRPSC
jgi:hypothetical protein